MPREAAGMIGKLVRALLGGLFLAGFVHVVAVLLIPDMAPRDAVSRVLDLAPPGAMAALPADGSILPDLDPYFTHAACPFDLATGPVELSGAMPDTAWSFAVVSKTGGIATSLERSAAVDNRIDVVVGRPGEVEQIRIARAASAAGGTTYAPVAADLGFVLVRAFVDEPEHRDDIDAALAALECGPYEE
jgi:uncharacterized membrane protein